MEERLLARALAIALSAQYERHWPEDPPVPFQRARVSNDLRPISPPVERRGSKGEEEYAFAREER